MIEDALRVSEFEGDCGEDSTKNYTGRVGALPKPPKHLHLFACLGIGMKFSAPLRTISGNQPEDEKNSGKKIKSVRYNNKMSGVVFNEVCIRSRYERVV